MVVFTIIRSCYLKILQLFPITFNMDQKVKYKSTNHSAYSTLYIDDSSGVFPKCVTIFDISAVEMFMTLTLTFGMGYRRM